MSNRAWMPLHIDDYIRDTDHLTALEHGAYLLLIMKYWREGGLPDDEGMIRRYAKLTPEQWAESRDVLAAFFDDEWRHKRIDAELAKAEEIIAKRRAAGKSSANAQHVPNSSKASVEQVRPTFNQEPTSETSSEVKRVPRDELLTVLDAERSEAIIEHRAKLRKPLSLRAAKLLAANFAKWHDPNEAADAMVRNGWQGFEPEWMQSRQRSHAPPDKPKKVTIASMWRDEARKRGILPDDTPDTINGRLETGHGDGHSPSHGFTRLIAGSGSG